MACKGAEVGDGPRQDQWSSGSDCENAGAEEPNNIATKYNEAAFMASTSWHRNSYLSAPILSESDWPEPRNATLAVFPGRIPGTV